MAEVSEGKVYIVDDDDAVRDGLSILLHSVGQTSECFEDGATFLDGYEGEGPACALFDVRMPGMSGLELLEEVRERGWDLPVIILTGHGDVPMAVDAMKAGALDFLQKPFREDELLRLIRQALEQHVTQSDEKLAKSAGRERLQSLTPRELEIARRVSDGQANKVISIELAISLRTVELHRARVMEKMQADSVADLVKMMLEVDDEA